MGQHFAKEWPPPQCPQGKYTHSAGHLFCRLEVRKISCSFLEVEATWAVWLKTSLLMNQWLHMQRCLLKCWMSPFTSFQFPNRWLLLQGFHLTYWMIRWEIPVFLYLNQSAIPKDRSYIQKSHLFVSRTTYSGVWKSDPVTGNRNSGPVNVTT